jgi:hypothetical protein
MLCLLLIVLFLIAIVIVLVMIFFLSWFCLNIQKEHNHKGV